MKIKSTLRHTSHAIVFFFSALPQSHAAVVLPNASADFVLYLNGVVSSEKNLPGQLTSNTSLQSPVSGTPAAKGTVLIAPEPTLTASTSLPNGVSQAISYDTFSYYFAVTSSTATQAHIIFSTNGSVSPSATTPNQASLEVDDNHSNTVYSAAACSGVGNDCNGIASSSSFSAAVPLTINTNTAYEVQESVYALAQTGLNTSSTSSIDPLITFDPNFNSTGLTLQFSLNVGNTPAAPEVSTWAMMIVGFCGLGFMACRKKGALRLA